MAQVTEIVLKVDATDAEKNVKQLKDELKACKEELADLDRESKNYQKTLDGLGKEKGLADLFGDISTALKDVADGFEAVQKGASLLGIENEALSSTFDKLQAGIGLFKSLQSITKGIDSAKIAFQAFNTVLRANPLILVAGLVATLITAFDKWEEVVDIITGTLSGLWEEIKDIADSLGSLVGDIVSALPFFDDTHDAFRKIGAAVVGVINAVVKLSTGPLKVLVKLLKGDFKGAWEEAKDGFNIVGNVVEGFNDSMARVPRETEKAGDGIDNFSGKVKKAGDTLTQTKKALEELRAEEEKQRVSELEYSDLVQEVNDYEETIRKLIETIKDETLADEEREQAAVSLSAAQQHFNTIRARQLELEQEISEQETSDLALQDRIAEATEKYNEKQAEGNKLLEKYNEELEFNNLNKEEQLEQLIREDEQLILNSNNRIEEINAELEAQELTAEREAELAEERLTILNELDQAEVRFTKNSNALSAERVAAEKKATEEKKKLQSAQLNATASFLSASAGMFESNTVASKVLSLASATISTYAGAAQVLADPLTSNPYVKWANFATTIATGLVAVKKIASTWAGGSDGGSGSASAGGAVSTPSLPTMPELSSPIQEVHNNTDAYDEDLLNQPPVLVVEDFRSAAGRISVAETNASV